MKKPKHSNLSESKDRSRDAGQCYEDPIATAAEVIRKTNTKKRKAEIQNRDQALCIKNDPKMEQKEKHVSEIDMLFGRLKEKTPKNESQDQALKKKEKTSKNKAARQSTDKAQEHDGPQFVGNKDDLFGYDIGKTRKRTEEGYAIYSEEELGLGKRGGGTAKCPFDCDCCF